MRSAGRSASWWSSNRSCIGQRQVAPDVADVAEVAQELSDERLGLSAVGAFEVAVLDDCDGCFDRPADVVAFWINLNVEVDERLVGAEQGVYPGAAREQRRGAKQEPRSDRRAKGGAEDAEFRLLQLRPVKGEGRD